MLRLGEHARFEQCRYLVYQCLELNSSEAVMDSVSRVVSSGSAPRQDIHVKRSFC